MRTAVIISLAIALTGCASSYKLQPQLADDQTKTVNYGQDVIISKKRNTVMVWPKNFIEKSNEKFSVMVSVTNNTDRTILLNSSEIRATFNGAPIATFTADEVLAEIDKRQRIATALAAFGGAMSAAGAASSGGRVRESGYVSGYSSSGQYISGTYTATGYSRAQAQSAVNAANAQTDANLASISASAQTQRERVDGPKLRSHSIQPGDNYGGAIYFDRISPGGGDDGKLVITVSIDNEVHTFNMGVRQVDY
jgi:hypothetical protein